jgi:HK97 gp10 family phage protein
MLKSRLPEIAVTLEPRVIAAVRAGAEAVEAEAKTRVPVASGALRDAIHTDLDGDDVYVVAGTDDVFYGHLVEHGTSRVPARPFLVPALEARRDSILNGVRAALQGL